MIALPLQYGYRSEEPVRFEDTIAANATGLQVRALGGEQAVVKLWPINDG